jgi:hypothetical protein
VIVLGASIMLARAARTPLAVSWKPSRPIEPSVATHAPLPRHGTVTPLPGARFAVESERPDEIVRLTDGLVLVDVTPLEAGERFRVIVGDAEIEVRGTAFEVEADHDRLVSVQVRRGRVEVRPKGRESVMLGPGETWAQPHEPAPASNATGMAKQQSLSVPRHEPTAASPVATTAPSAATTSFDEAWRALRAGDPSSAASAFAKTIDLDPDGPLAEDASFWRGVALGRAKQNAAARAALEAFLAAYPSSPHAGDASVMLGWMRLDDGDVAAADALFRAAAKDPSPRVREAALAGLDAVAKRK